MRVTEECAAADCDCGSAACTFTRDSLSVAGMPATEVSVSVEHDGSDVVLSVDP
jgi:hypothetical protein